MNLLVVTTLLAFGIRIYTLLGTGTFATLCLYSFGIAIEWLVLTYVAWRIDD